MNNKIFLNEWMSLHPYKEQSKTDAYYAGIANSIMEILEKNEIQKEVGHEQGIKMLSCMVAGWFEDIVSETEIWKSFQLETKRRTGSYLPFYQLSDTYEVNEVNREDIQFLLWHGLQQLAPRTFVLNPNFPILEKASAEIRALLAKEFDDAPSNYEIQDLMEAASKNLNAYIHLLNWFHYGSFFGFMKNDREFAEQAEHMKKQMEEQKVPAEKMNESMGRMHLDMCFYARANFWAMTSVEWLNLILDEFMGKEKPEAVETKDVSTYAIDRIEENQIYLKDALDEESEPFAVMKFQMPEDTEKKYLVRSPLLKHNGAWYLNGFYAIAENQEEQLNAERQFRSGNEMKKKGCKEIYDKMTEAENGVPMVFLHDRNDLVDYLQNKLKCSPELIEHLPQEIKEDFMLSASEEEGFIFLFNQISALKSEKNPFYKPEDGKKNALWFATFPEACPKDVLNDLIKFGLLDDAQINDEQEPERGKQVIQNNWDFWTTYYTRR